MAAFAAEAGAIGAPYPAGGTLGCEPPDDIGAIGALLIGDCGCADGFGGVYGAAAGADDGAPARPAF